MRRILKNLLAAGVMAVFAVSATSAQDSARLQVIHNSADPAAALVDVYINDAKLLDDFGFRQATAFIDAPAGVPFSIGIAPSGSVSAEDTLRSFQVTLEANETYVALANGVLDPMMFQANPDGRASDFTLFVKPMAREAGMTGDVDFYVVHGATDAPVVDVEARGVGLLVDDAGYGDQTGYLTVPPASYVLDVKDASGTVTVASFAADLSGLGGGAAVVFASGFLNPVKNQLGSLFGLYAALADGSVIELPVTTARIQVIHNAADPAAEAVDIYLNGSLLLDDFAFRTATPFVDVPAQLNLNIGVAPATSGSFADTLTTFDVALGEEEKYIVFANGVLDPGSFAINPDGRSTAFSLFVKPMARETATGMNVEFFLEHGATDAPTVDVVAQGVGTLVDNAGYGDITDYIEVPPAAYVLEVRDSTGTIVVATVNADLSGLAGGTAAVFASGFLNPSANQNGEPFGVYAALADGTVIPLDQLTSVEETDAGVPTRIDLMQNYPNPFNPSTQIEFAVPQQGLATLKVFNIAGQEVATLVNQELGAGSYSVTFNGSDVSSGVYFYTLSTGGKSVTKSMMLVK